MRAVLKIVSGPYEGRRMLLLPGQSVKVGRTEFADFAVPHDNHMSSVHFALRCDAGTCQVQDLNSTNGTLVNGERTTEALLHDGDTIYAGRTTFTVEIEPTSPAPSPAVPSVAPPEKHADLASLAAYAQVTVVQQPFRSAVPSVAASAGRPYDKALMDEDPLVRREALQTAAWTGQKWLLDYCRQQAARPSPEAWDAVSLLAVLGQPSDVERILLIGRMPSLGSRRFQILAAYGHPRVVNDLLKGIASPDPRMAVAAGAAFTKITGAEIGSQERVPWPPEDGSQPDEFEREFLEEACLPSLDLAVRHWQRVEGEFAQGTRWRRGFDLSGGLTPELLAQLDLEGRWEACLRGKYEGTWKGSLQELERFRPRLGAGG